MLLTNPRWGRWSVSFLALSGVGRTIADGTDEESAHAVRMDESVVWEARRGRVESRRAKLTECFSFLCFVARIK